MINNVIQLMDIDIFTILERRQKIFGDLNFCVDAGAAAGLFSSKIFDINPATEVYAYEPFPGNWVYLENRLKKYEGAKICKRALSDKLETRKFYINSVVDSNNSSFAKNMLGYSSVGTFFGKSDRSQQIIDVECVPLDEEIQNRNVNFFKMDVQGAEPLVLKGASHALEQGIDMMFIEFSFQPKLMQILKDYKYVCFDTEYLLVSEAQDTELLKSGFSNLKQVTLSNGVIARKAKYHGFHANLQSSDFRRKLKINFLQTDLIAIHKYYLNKFFYIISLELSQKFNF
ncbi:FkbM family methyltransferase [Geitlerinema sp. PCC 9228]|uniref:FkbM family methyltransferase n=1 Tax=Geitlerinema sp. PCC 9228 TaxID=111611 RepID=UPI0008F9BCAE|nr:FkbM family methyltransferase [Geitlerinema sp. PCC 9228]